ncbi:MAG: hypothetical protein ABI679_03280 [Gemmatimonadota bacterium]
MSRKKIVTILLVIGFFGLLLFNTLSAQKATCEVCMEYNGHRNCATASHESAAEATQSAQSTACGPLTNGMNDQIACGRRPPISTQCRTK